MQLFQGKKSIKSMETVVIKYLTSLIAIVIVIRFLIVVFKKIRKNKIRKENRKLLENVTQLHRGTDSEKYLILGLLKHQIPSQTIFHDLYLKIGNGKFSQIDIVIATKVGIIVIEVKDYSGWIFGTGYKPKWTQVLAYGNKKYRFLNPIIQNSNHIKHLKKKLNEDVPFFSLIVFDGGCELKDINYIPKQTYVLKSHRLFDVITKILKENQTAKYLNKKRVIQVLKRAVENGNSINNQNQHVKNINDELGTQRLFR